MTTKAGGFVKIGTSKKSIWWQVLGIETTLPEFEQRKKVIIYSGQITKRINLNEIKKVKICK